MATRPASLTIRTYEVGFGDCFLLSFRYGPNSEKHVLIDFGSTGMPKTLSEKPDARMMKIANDIKKRCNGSLTAVVATHRHKDHISGFATKTGGKGPGDVIRSLKPALVLQPWTEDPKLDPKAKGPANKSDKSVNRAHIAALGAMHRTASHVLEFTNSKALNHLPSVVRNELAFLGEDNILNKSAVSNLMTMGKNEYLFYGRQSGLEKLLPGVKINVLGPPTVNQSSEITKERSSDPNEFWQFQANALAKAATRGPNGSTSLFPHHVLSRGPAFPVNARWFVYHARAAHGEQLLQIVRTLDAAMNNTSIILLLQIGNQSLLFPGDAQIENWSYALSKTENKTLLSNTNLYKVGHHGSRNATPKSLWALFKNRSTKKSAARLVSLMSSMEGKHGTELKHTEVPRQSLVDALDKETDFFTTQSLADKDLFHDTPMQF